MEGGRVGVGVGVGEEQEMSDGMQCSDHPYRNNPGGICAFCLQEKLGKLVSSSFPLPIPIPPPPSSSSSSPSFRSQLPPTLMLPSTSPPPPPPPPPPPYARRTRLPFLLPIKKNNKKPPTSDILLKRSKSTATPRRNHSFLHTDVQDFSPRKRNGFWSFLYLSSKSSKKLNNNNTPSRLSAPGTSTTSSKLKDKCCPHILVQQDNTTSPDAFDRKVSRSRSVGCGSRSFSGDFFERISTGFGDCTLRRVESQREGKPKGTAASVAGTAVSRGSEHHHHHHHHCMKERVRCGGLFSGFMMTSSSSSSSSSSYWVSSSADDAAAAAAANGKTAPLSHNRGKSWGWAFASPMRAFSIKPSSNRRDINIIRDANDKNPTPNLSAIPSLLAVRA